MLILDLPKFTILKKKDYQVKGKKVRYFASFKLRLLEQPNLALNIRL